MIGIPLSSVLVGVVMGVASLLAPVLLFGGVKEGEEACRVAPVRAHHQLYLNPLHGKLQRCFSHCIKPVTFREYLVRLE